MKVYIGKTEFRDVAEAVANAKPGDAILLVGDPPQPLYFGVYTCHVCDKTYTVNDAWGPCTPDTCHSCYERLTREPANESEITERR